MWKANYLKQTIRCGDIVEYMKTRKEANRIFILNFLILFATCFAGSTKYGICKKFLPSVSEDAVSGHIQLLIPGKLLVLLVRLLWLSHRELMSEHLSVKEFVLHLCLLLWGSLLGF